MRLRSAASMCVSVAAAVLIGCNEEEVCPAPTQVAVHSGDAQIGPPCAPLDQLLTVRVQCANNQPYTGSTSVEWQVDTGGGSVDPPIAATDAAGRASTRLTLGASLGETVVHATAAGLPHATFTAEAIAPCDFARPLPLGTPPAGTWAHAIALFPTGPTSIITA